MTHGIGWMRVVFLSLLFGLLASCGGGGGGSTGSSGASGGGTTPTPTPAPFNDIPQTDAEAARFLTEATFGPTSSEIARLRQIGYSRWLDEQMDPARTPATLLLPHIHQMTVNDTLDYRERRNYWLWKTVGASDQLRMRMGFALSEIFVVSDRDYNNKNFERITHYQDMLDQGAFGSYRSLLEQVTLHPAMGTYLSHLANQKAVTYKNAQGLQVSVVPDENYAREVMQLFSIGLVERNPDFSPVLDANGATKATYDQSVIAAMARVFTGWTWAGNTDANYWAWAGHDNDYRAMECHPKFHDDQAKLIFRGITIAGTSDCKVTLQQTLDALATHPNVAPFISRQLIQRFVTSNPSPAYIGRVSKAWTDSNGDLGKVLRAILLDVEARVPPAATDASFGKMREPLLQLTALWRAFDAKYLPATNGTYMFRFSNSWDFTTTLMQDSLRSPSVFNFFEPDYRLPAAGGIQGIYAPEMQLYNEASFGSIFNQQLDAGWNNFATTAPTANTPAPVMDINPLLTLANNNDHAGMVAKLDVLLFYGTLSPDSRRVMVDMLDKLKAANRPADERVRSLVQLAVSSPEFVVQR